MSTRMRTLVGSAALSALLLLGTGCGAEPGAQAADEAAVAEGALGNAANITEKELNALVRQQQGAELSAGEQSEVLTSTATPAEAGWPCRAPAPPGPC